MRPFFLLLLVWFQFGIIAVNYRAVAQGRYAATILTDAVIAIAGFTLFRLIAESGDLASMAGYTAGAALGGATGIWLTRHWT